MLANVINQLGITLPDGQYLPERVNVCMICFVSVIVKVVVVSAGTVSN